jgi:hypothetical protein
MIQNLSFEIELNNIKIKEEDEQKKNVFIIKLLKSGIDQIQFNSIRSYYLKRIHN